MRGATGEKANNRKGEIYGVLSNIIDSNMYRRKLYGAVKTRDFKTWTDITNLVSFPAGHKYGTVFEAPISVLEGLKKHKQHTEQESLE